MAPQHAPPRTAPQHAPSREPADAKLGGVARTRAVNEFIPFNREWCNNTGMVNVSCDWQSDESRGVRINRKTLGWSAAAAAFAYAFGRLSELGSAARRRMCTPVEGAAARVRCGDIRAAGPTTVCARARVRGGAQASRGWVPTS